MEIILRVCIIEFNEFMLYYIYVKITEFCFSWGDTKALTPDLTPIQILVKIISW